MGQFLDHDIDLTDTGHPTEPFPIAVPADDPSFLPGSSIGLSRSVYDPATGSDPSNPRQQINQISSFIDASNVYGSDPVRAKALRSELGGALKTSSGNMLPYNVEHLPNAAPAPLPAEHYYLAGDVRANEQTGLTAMHTLFVREHNRLAAKIAADDFAGENLADPLIDEQIYQQARQIVGGLMQSVTYNEFLPALLGPNGVSSYAGYQQDVNPGIANIFSGALYRVGHTMLPQELHIYNNDGSPMGDGAVDLDEAFFNPGLLSDGTNGGMGIEPFLMGLSKQYSQEIDNHVVDSMRNMNMGPAGQFDLAAINMQRGREHGLPDYNQARIDVGLSPVRRFSEITSDRSTARKLAKVYDHDINNVDVWLGGISERHIPGGSVGELVQTVLVDQFERLRDGDRFYFENTMDAELVAEIHGTRLADIILRNTSISTLHSELFRGESVLAYRALSDEAADITIGLKGGNWTITDNQTGELLVSRPKNEVSSLVVFGSTEGDTISFDHSINKRNVPIEVHGNGGNDRLCVIGNRHKDAIVVAENHLRFNTSTIVFGSFEEIEVSAKGGNDMVLGMLSSVPLIISGEEGMIF